MLSNRVQNILDKNLQWQEVVQKALFLQPMPPNYSPRVVEMFDQEGLLVGMAWGVFYEMQRDPQIPSDFIAWYYDGQLALFHVGEEVVVNRLEQGVMKKL